MNKIKQEFDNAKREWLNLHVEIDDKAEAMKRFKLEPSTIPLYFSTNEKKQRTNEAVLRFFEKCAEKRSGSKYQAN